MRNLRSIGKVSASGAGYNARSRRQCRSRLGSGLTNLCRSYLLKLVTGSSLSPRRCSVRVLSVRLVPLSRFSVILSKSLSRSQCRSVLRINGLLLVSGILVVLKNIPRCRSKKRSIGPWRKLRNRLRSSGLLRIQGLRILVLAVGPPVRRSIRYLSVQSKSVLFLRKQWVSNGRRGRLRATVLSNDLLLLPSC